MINLLTGLTIVIMHSSKLNILTHPPIFCPPHPRDNASVIDIGRCLKGLDKNNEECIIGYYSQKFYDNKWNWNIIEKEACTIVQGIRQFLLLCDDQLVTNLHNKQIIKNRKLLNNSFMDWIKSNLRSRITNRFLYVLNQTQYSSTFSLTINPYVPKKNY